MQSKVSENATSGAIIKLKLFQENVITSARKCAPCRFSG
jgi:hypothetical protein